MSQTRASVKESFIANAALAAYRIVELRGANTVGYATGTASYMIGVTEDASEGATGSAVSVITAGTAKVQCNDTTTVGRLITSAANGLGVQLATSNAINTASCSRRAIGLGMEAASASGTGAVIEVRVNPVYNAIISA